MSTHLTRSAPARRLVRLALVSAGVAAALAGSGLAVAGVAGIGFAVVRRRAGAQG